MSGSDAAQWLRLARIDLESAQVLAAIDPPPIEPALFHCAQAAERALKSVTARAEPAALKTHDLGALLFAALVVNPSLAVQPSHATLLNGFAVDPRYPRGGDAYTDDEVADALAAAARVVQAVETS